MADEHDGMEEALSVEEIIILQIAGTMLWPIYFFEVACVTVYAFDLLILHKFVTDIC